MIHRTQLKTEQNDRFKLMNLKDDFEKKENDWNKERSEIRGQAIVLTETNVKFYYYYLKFFAKVSTIEYFIVVFFRRSSKDKI